MSIADDLEKLHSLKEQGILTESEFAAQKQILLAGQNRPAVVADPYRAPQATGGPRYASAEGEVIAKMSPKDIMFSFEGRIPRVAYWAYSMLCSLAWGLGFVVGLILAEMDGAVIGAGVAVLATIWPLYAIQIKRWHDRDMSGWWCLINFLPYVGSLVSFVACGCMRGTIGPNRFGPDATDLY